MSRIHEALQKARLHEDSILSEVPSVEDIITSKSLFGEPEKAGDIGANALPFSMLEQPVAEPEIPVVKPELWVAEPEAPPQTLVTCPRGNWPRSGTHLVFFGDRTHLAGQEQFRTLRSRLSQMRRGTALQVLAISSALPGEGKSFVSANLAHALALQSERGVLVIDADMRRAGGLSAVLESPISPGLSEYLSGESDALDVIQSGTVPKLFVLPCGRRVENPGELVGTSRVATLLKKLRSMFDWIIIDTPPVVPIADARTIAELSDGVLLVVNARSTLADLAKRAMQEFRRESLLGVVLNRTSDASASYYAEYGYGYGTEQSVAEAK